MDTTSVATLAAEELERARREGRCLSCGAQFARLYTHIRTHGTLDDYCKRHGYPHGTKFMSADFARQLQGSGARIWSRIPNAKQRKIRGTLSALRGHPRPQSFSQTGGAATWEIVKLRVAGLSYQEIGRQLRIGYTTIQHRCATLGFPRGRRICFDFGEPVTWKTLRALRAASGLTQEEFAARVGVARSQLGRAPESQHLGPKLAAAALRWRDQATKRLLTADLVTRRRNHYRTDGVIETLYPSVRGAYGLLVEALPRLKKFLGEGSADQTLEGVAAFVAARAQEEAAHGKPRTFGRLLQWLPQLSSVLELNRIRQMTSVRQAALAMLAHACSADSGSIDYVVRRRAPHLAPEKMRALLMLQDAKASAAPVPKKGGRPKGLHATTEEKLRKAAAALVLGWTKWQQRTLLYPDSGSDLAYSNTKKLHREHKTEIEALKTSFTKDSASSYIGHTGSK